MNRNKTWEHGQTSLQTDSQERGKMRAIERQTQEVGR